MSELKTIANRNGIKRSKVAHMIADYERAIASTSAVPAPVVTLPAHLRSDGFEHARDLATSVGITLPDGWQ